ncbi:septal ring lytic transglycosylase RlpA family protein [Halomonas sp. I5-271120]|uniref:septal ring lytic transglycosylase RlpA family protein n=1 Tax=Halomonas sp. I5-271120 TaxID=3061632 RepID=UPI0027F45964
MMHFPTTPRGNAGSLRFFSHGALALLILLLTGCAGQGTRDDTAGGGLGADVVSSEVGMATYYADRYHGRTTASGERFDQKAMTAAHRTLAFGTRVRVTRLDDGREVTVRINDRGPFVRGRVIDLSKRAARQLGMMRDGTVKVRLSVLR